MKKLLVSAVLVSALFLNVHSQAGTPLIKVIVAPDHQDWTYRVNEKAKFTVQVFKYGNLLENVTVDYEAGPDMLPDIKKEGVVLRNGRLELTGTMKQPGFYRVRVWAVADGKRYEGLGTAAFEPEKIQPSVKDPSDFDSFWNDEIAKARKMNLDPRITLVPERCTGDANVYHISFQNEAAGSRIYGMLAMPKKPGRYPAILRVPGAGIRPYSGDTRIAG
ncbi:MAG: acetylxylan esterase, partial [Bacteroidales bacterium]|nr:acetylxylan esterase [Bacteroidales bacterium]